MDKKSKESIQHQQQILHLLVNIAEMYPQYTLAQHFAHVLRRKSERQEPYFWSDDLLLKKFEDYYDELKNDLANNISDEENY